MEKEDFSNEDQLQCIYSWEFFAYIFFGIRKTPTRKISTNQTPPWWISLRNSHLELGIYYRYHWYYLKECFIILCFKSAEVFTLVKICQNEVLSEERQLMKWVGKFRWEFSGWQFCWGNFPGGSLMGGNFSDGNSPGGNFPKTIFFIWCIYSYFSEDYQQI